MTQKYKITKKQAALLALPVLLLVLAVCAAPYLPGLAAYFPSCPIYRTLGLLCPACGNTRCVLALFRLDLRSAFQANAVLPLFLSFLGIGYAELVLYAFGRRIRLLPRSPAFYWASLVLCIGYWVIRNLV